MDSLNDFFHKKLEKRLANNSLRTLVQENSLIDFCSTDYLGFARNQELKTSIIREMQTTMFQNFSSSTGSRLMRGNYAYTEELENKIAGFHKAESALIFNSGYDANVGFFSCVPQKADIILHDELIHASSRDGMGLSMAEKFSFRHNDAMHLDEMLRKFEGSQIFVAVESVYSMNGDFAPLKEIAEICEKYNAHLIVDEAHATGVFGPMGEGRVVEHGLQEKVLAVVHTFGKGLGCHGAVVLCSNLLRNFLINFCHSFIYSTAIPPINLIAINCAYELLRKKNNNQKKINDVILLFKQKIKTIKNIEIIPSNSPIQCIIISGNEQVKFLAKKVQEKGYDVRAVLSPAVPKGMERLRICLHTFNTEEEVVGLIENMNNLKMR